MSGATIKTPAGVLATAASIIQVGGGRGFIVSATHDERYVVTAAHCLPYYPEPHLANGASELSYANILGPLGVHEGTVWAELTECNAISDIAVLGAPDGDEWEQYEAFTSTAMTIGQSPQLRRPHEWTVETATSAWVLSLDGQWRHCTVQNGGRFLMMVQGELVESGMSGSPIVNDDGAAIGVVSTGGDGFNLNPSLTDCLPQWLLRTMTIGALQTEEERTSCPAASTATSSATAPTA